ncbi:MAG: acetylornithine deacetylase, partial [Methylococcaceae bacterium]|nr:acetylornithine deacetylase [Methylococcaceae bacterium]
MNASPPDVLTLIRTLIARPSVSCTDPGFDSSNLGVIHVLADWLASLGFSVSIHEFSPGKANLLAGLGGGGAVGEGLVLSGHTDTVPFDEGEWSV